ncbi:hypothetical protein GF351_02065 [Candidatus Woesearchaeota archaeon]|nr:hypothetical protein [Candidatus Woesearchaeota archaeon]
MVFSCLTDRLRKRDEQSLESRIEMLERQWHDLRQCYAAGKRSSIDSSLYEAFVDYGYMLLQHSKKMLEEIYLVNSIQSGVMRSLDDMEKLKVRQARKTVQRAKKQTRSIMRSYLSCMGKVAEGFSEKKRKGRKFIEEETDGKIKEHPYDTECALIRSLLRRHMYLYGRYSRQKRDSRKKTPARYSFRGNIFDSLAEAACGVLMEKYITGWKIIEGETFQVNGSIPKAIDFYVRGVFVEYHPIILSRKEHASVRYSAEKASVPRQIQKQFREKLELQQAQSYLLQRKMAIDRSPVYRGAEIMLIRDPEELYDHVIKRFGCSYPAKEDFLQEFSKVKKKVKKSG